MNDSKEAVSEMSVPHFVVVGEKQRPGVGYNRLLFLTYEATCTTLLRHASMLLSPSS